MLGRPSLYVNFLQVLRAQLLFAPEDFFLDELCADNFLHASLAALASRTSSCDLAAPLRSELARFWAFVGERFGSEMVEQLLAGGDEDDSPVVVPSDEIGHVAPSRHG
uniref:AAR2 C-terminal domain-containing protein n=1 Tax=Calcidiscus leptoporus TaxID=127549 RepID=A0A7S0IU72_9EUKA